MELGDPVIVAAVEGGGTSFVVAIAALEDGKREILHRTEVDSSHDRPQQTLKECADFLKQHKPSRGYHALGLATFGPVGLNPSRSDYGCILPTSPKASWRRVNLVQPLQRACRGSRQLVVRVETDVNAPALAEYMACDPSKISSVSYVTVGTGVGVGLVIDGKCVHGRMHPEGGHVPVQPLAGDNFPGYSWGIERSPFKGVHTVEGLASSVALTERLAHSQQLSSVSALDRSVLSELPDDHDVWNHAANAVANLCVTMLLLTSTEKIVLGGGVLKRNGLMEQIRLRTVQLLNGYLELPTDMADLITFSKYGDDAGLMGAIVMAEKGLADESATTATKDSGSHFWSGVIHGLVTGAALAGAALLLSRRK